MACSHTSFTSHASLAVSQLPPFTHTHHISIGHKLQAEGICYADSPRVQFLCEGCVAVTLISKASVLTLLLRQISGPDLSSVVCRA